MFTFSRCTSDIITTFWYSFWLPTLKNLSRVSIPGSSLLWFGLACDQTIRKFFLDKNAFCLSNCLFLVYYQEFSFKRPLQIQDFKSIGTHTIAINTDETLNWYTWLGFTSSNIGMYVAQLHLSNGLQGSKGDPEGILFTPNT